MTDQGLPTKDPGRHRHRLLLVNQFPPPDPAPTARLLGEVGEELRRRGHEVVYLGDRADYRGGRTLLGSRALRELLSLARIQWRLLRAPAADGVIFLTSPPLLPLVSLAGRLRHRRAKWIHWAMDLYPDVAVALGEVREGSLLHRATAGAMAAVYRRCDLILALDEAMRGRIAAPEVPHLIVEPWPGPVAGTAEAKAGQERPFTWLYSGNLGRAHEWRTLLEAQARLETAGHPVDLVFQGGGPELEIARAAAAALGLKRCHWRDYAPEADLLASLLAADALIVTQHPETAGCLWPSKLSLVRLLGRPLVWVGPEGTIADEMRKAGHYAGAPEAAEALADHLAALAAGPRPSSCAPQDLLDRITSLRESSLDRVATAIETSLSAPS